MCGVVHCWRPFDTPGIRDKCLIDQLCRDTVCFGTDYQLAPTPLRDDDDDAGQGEGGGQTAEGELHIYRSLQITQENSH